MRNSSWLECPHRRGLGCLFGFLCLTLFPGFLSAQTPPAKGVSTGSPVRMLVASMLPISRLHTIEADCELARLQASLDAQRIDTGGNFAGGFASGFLGASLLGIAGFNIGYSVTPPSGDEFIFNEGKLTGGTIGLIVGFIGGGILGTQIAVGAAAEPQSRLTHFQATPEGRAAYNDDFKKRGLAKKRQAASSGGAVGVITPIVLLVIVAISAH
jgi:hypothetical protein